MGEVLIKFGWRKRLGLLFGEQLRLVFAKKVEGTFVDKEGNLFINLKDYPKPKTKNMASLFG